MRLEHWKDIQPRALLEIARLNVEIVAAPVIPKQVVAVVASWLDDAQVQVHEDRARFSQTARGQVTFKIPMDDGYELKRYQKSYELSDRMEGQRPHERLDFMYHCAKEVLRLHPDIILMLSTLYEHPGSES